MKEIANLLRDTSAARVTTLIDLYGLPDDFPGKDTAPRRPPVDRIAHLELALKTAVNHRRFDPYLMLHEFETLVFVNPQLAAPHLPPEVISSLQTIRAQFVSPEDINETRTGAPSKRILATFPQYEKARHGPLVVKSIGLASLRKACPHFDGWVARLEQLGSGGAHAG